MSLTPYSDLFSRISSDDSFIQIVKFLIMSAPNQAQVQKPVETQAIDSTPSSIPADNLPAIVTDPTVGIILAFAVLVRAILGGSSSIQK
jgi:hypothetical protein